MIAVIVCLLAVVGQGVEVEFSDAAEEDIVVSRKTGGWATANRVTVFDSSVRPVEVFGTPRYQEDNKKPLISQAIQEEQKVDSKIEKLECNSIFNITAILPELSIWMEALNAANLMDVFADPKFNEATYLIPTNDAFLAFFDYLGVDKEASLADPQMKDILLYHILPNTATIPVNKYNINNNNNNFNNNNFMLTSALTGKNIRMEISNEIILYFGWASRACVINQLQICEGGAIIQVIDEVLMSDQSQLAITCSNQSVNALRSESNISLWVCDRS